MRQQKILCYTRHILCQTVDGKFLYRYLDDEFVWDISDAPNPQPTPNQGNPDDKKQEDDTTKKEGPLPDTGISIFATGIVLAGAWGAIAYRKNKKYNQI